MVSAFAMRSAKDRNQRFHTQSIDSGATDLGPSILEVPFQRHERIEAELFESCLIQKYRREQKVDSCNLC